MDANSTLMTVFYLLLVLLMLIGPFILGGYLAKALRMPDYSWKIGLILFLLIVSVSMIRHQMAAKIRYRLSVVA